jgi:hypothetical protein
LRTVIVCHQNHKTGIGVHKDQSFAAQDYHCAAKQSHPDGTTNFGLTTGMAVSLNKPSHLPTNVTDSQHCEGKLNHRGCLRLLGRWERPDHSSDGVSHPPSLDWLADIPNKEFQQWMESQLIEVINMKM